MEKLALGGWRFFKVGVEVQLAFVLLLPWFERLGIMAP